MTGALLDTPMKGCGFVSQWQFFCHPMVIYLLLKLVIEDWVWNIMITKFLGRPRWTEAPHNPWARNWAGGQPLGLSADPSKPLMAPDRWAFSIFSEEKQGGWFEKAPWKVLVCCLGEDEGWQDPEDHRGNSCVLPRFNTQRGILGALSTLVKGNKEPVN